MIDIKKEVRDFLFDHGYPILLVRRDSKVRCHCLESSNGSVSSSCPNCLGTGFFVKIEKHLTYSRISSVPETLPKLIRQAEISSIAIEAKVFYFVPQVAPKRGDYIVVGDFRGAHPIPPLDFFEVNHAEKYRAYKGEVQFHKAFCSINPVNTNIKGFNLRQIGGIANYVPVYR